MPRKSIHLAIQWNVASPIELCVPQDLCLTVTARYQKDKFLHPQWNVFLEYGGNPVTMSGPFPYDGAYDGASKVVARVGDSCEVSCNEDESLLELKIEATDMQMDAYKYYVLNSKTGQKVAECSKDSFWDGSRCSWEDHAYIPERICLPKNGCYTLVASEHRFQDWMGPSVLTIWYDGKRIAQVKDMQYEAIDFGAASCPTPCEVDEKLVEVFVHRRHHYPFYEDKIPNMTWALTTSSHGELATTKKVSGTILPKELSPTYYRMCGASDVCARLDLSVPETYELDDDYGIVYGELDTYRLVVDGVIYGEGEYFFGFGEHPTFNTTTFGGNCSSSVVCMEGESLLTLLITTGHRSQYWSARDVGWSSSTHEKYHISSEPHYDIGHVFPDTTNEYLSCFPTPGKGTCVQFQLHRDGLENGNIAEYKIVVNDGPVLESFDCHYCYKDHIVEYTVGDCPQAGAANTETHGFTFWALLVAIVVALCICGWPHVGGRA